MEFTLAFMLLLLFLVLATRLFVWFNGGILRRQLAYEATRVEAGTSPMDHNNTATGGNPGTLGYGPARRLDILSKNIFNNTP